MMKNEINYKIVTEEAEVDQSAGVRMTDNLIEVGEEVIF